MVQMWVSAANDAQDSMSSLNLTDLKHIFVYSYFHVIALNEYDEMVEISEC